MDLQQYLRRQAERINAELDRLVPPENAPPETIHKAMRYSLFAGGKRIRPVLALAASHAVQPGCPGIEAAACSLELIHTYSLIHDDLPALDNDDLRRGRPTCHKVFGEAMAILAGDALLTAAFQVLAGLACGDGTKVRIIAELSSASGTVGGMIGGQVHDLEGEGRKPDAELLDRIHRAKTGALLRASVRIGALYAGATGEQLAAFSKYGAHIGLAFQIVDDVLDVEQSSEALGKTAGKDAAQQKITFPAVYGLDASKVMAARELDLALGALAGFGEEATWLRGIAALIVRRTA
ncbi:MAG: polyprenyl synthetase family protein [Acidobacteriia bacterium]|nr:polyprenyl synthetase family protein [Terriglobia bacterium]